MCSPPGSSARTSSSSCRATTLSVLDVFLLPSRTWSSKAQLCSSLCFCSLAQEHQSGLSQLAQVTRVGTPATATNSSRGRTWLITSKKRSRKVKLRLSYPFLNFIRSSSCFACTRFVTFPGTCATVQEGNHSTTQLKSGSTASAIK